MFQKCTEATKHKASSKIIQIKNKSDEMLWNEPEVRKCWKKFFQRFLSDILMSGIEMNVTVSYKNA